MRTSWALLALHLKFLMQSVHAGTVYIPPYEQGATFKKIENHHDFAQLLVDHQNLKEEAYNFAKSKGWIRYPLKMKREFTELNYTAYPFLDELLKLHPEFGENEKKNKKFYYMDERRCGNRRALRQFKLKYNRMLYSIIPPDPGRTTKARDISEEIRNPVKYMKDHLVKMDRAIDYIDVQVLKNRMSTPADFVKMKERAEAIRKRIYAIEYNGTENYTPLPPRTLKVTRVTVRPIRGQRLKILRAAFPQWFVDVNITTPSSLEVVSTPKSHSSGDDSIDV
ncbi:hypothetical protein M8J76_011067 [Diaphorina citri]|jgi:hypothetical protein|nr:hypothetical protein M8J75_007791 [Diaphorina citri]KAI5745434.1 hypothetical protein M8J76_011067 [Diaphorina citri]KAI5753247.1 hypothetical protein M8J77_025076 [Diaphorina citri]